MQYLDVFWEIILWNNQSFAKRASVLLGTPHQVSNFLVGQLRIYENPFFDIRLENWGPLPAIWKLLKVIPARMASEWYSYEIQVEVQNKI